MNRPNLPGAPAPHKLVHEPHEPHEQLATIPASRRSRRPFVWFVDKTNGACGARPRLACSHDTSVPSVWSVVQPYSASGAHGF